MLLQINNILDAQLKKLSDDEDISEYVKRLLDAMDYNVAYTANALMKKLGLKSKETFRKHYLNVSVKTNPSLK